MNPFSPNNLLQQGRLSLAAASLAFAASASAQFVEEFETGAPIPRVSPNEGGGWSWYGGNGEIEVDLLAREGHATMQVDARQDRLNIWWAVIRSRVDEALPWSRMAPPGRELRIEARVRVSHAPRRINLQLFTSGTTGHSHLREFDIPVAGEWRVVSMTTEDFPFQEGSPIFCQLAMMDWGGSLYQTDVDFIKVSVVDPTESGPDLGHPQRYQPPLPDTASLPHRSTVSADLSIDSLLPEMNLHDWGVPSDDQIVPRLLPVSSSQTALLRWNLNAFNEEEARGIAVLELTTASLSRILGDFNEIGRLRVVEILPDAPDWTESDATYASFLEDQALDQRLNPQPVIDVLVDPRPGAATRIAIPQTVMQRLIDGRSKGLALTALGPVNATFYARENGQPERAPTLAFATKESSR